MHVPQTSAPMYFYMDPSERFVQFNQFSLPTLQAFSVINRATELPIIQTTTALQPVWAKGQLAGPFIANSSSGTIASSGTSGGAAGLVFSGAAFLEYDQLASTFSGAETPMTIVCQTACGSSGGTIWSLASTSSTTPKLSLSYSGGTLSLTEVNGNGTFTTSATVDTNVHVITAIRANNTLTLRLDSAVIGTPTAITAGTENFNTFVLGALNSNGSVSSQFNGKMGKVLAYGGSADIYPLETELLLQLGIIRSPSSGINSGGF